MINTSDVDAVTTLCSEEVCPVFSGNVICIHWSMPDPAIHAGEEQTQMDIFRNIRDQIKERLTYLFFNWDLK
ncbi:MAG: hypothetical protein HQK53_10045 [Oligoflexia bacterium]|nr:hypothetical protein [Oligoflexia bacterium]